MSFLHKIILIFLTIKYIFACYCSWDGCSVCTLDCRSCEICQNGWLREILDENETIACAKIEEWRCKTYKDLIGCTTCEASDVLLKISRNSNYCHPAHCKTKLDFEGCTSCEKDFFLFNDFINSKRITCIWAKSRNFVNCRTWQDEIGCTSCWEGGNLIPYSEHQTARYFAWCSGGTPPENEVFPLTWIIILSVVLL